MKKIVLLLLGAASVVLVGCKNKGNNPEDPKKPDETSTVLTTKYYLNDSLLQYVDVSIVDSCHLELGNLPYTTAVLDTLAEAEFWSRLRLFYKTDKDLQANVPISSIKVLTVTRQITAKGNYNNRIRFVRNSAADHSASIGMITARTAYSTSWLGGNYLSTNSSVKLSDLMVQLQSEAKSMKVDFTF